MNGNISLPFYNTNNFMVKSRICMFKEAIRWHKNQGGLNINLHRKGGIDGDIHPLASYHHSRARMDAG
jgi:hypothetical protein